MNFPPYDVKIKDCTPEMCRTIVALAEKLNVPVYNGTKNYPFNRNFPFIHWAYYSKMISQTSDEEMKSVSLDQFISYMISDPAPEISERDKKLKEVAEMLQQGIEKLKQITTI